MPTSTPDHDVVIVGARCAGAATALLAARQGLDVALVDRARFPSDTLSTHALARGAMVQLARWGLLDELMAGDLPAIRKVTIQAGGAERVLPVKARAGIDHLAAPRRHVLDHLLVGAAVAAGARLDTGVRVTGLDTAHGRVTGVRGIGPDGEPFERTARVVVGADGVRSRVARTVGAPVTHRCTPGGATRYLYVRRPDWDGFELHQADGIQAGVFPTHAGEANVWVCTPAASRRSPGSDPVAHVLELLAAASPGLAERVVDGEVTSPVRAAVGLPNHLRRPWGPGWALVGDAGAHRDPVTGHGITDAFRDAELLATALGRVARGEAGEAEAGARYEHDRDAVARELVDLTAAMSRYPSLPDFVALHLRVNRAVEAEAELLSQLPDLRSLTATAA